MLTTTAHGGRLRPTPSQVMQHGWKQAKGRLKGSVAAGSLNAAASLYSHICSVSTLRSWLFWFMHSEDTILEWSLTVPIGHYIKLAFGEALHGIFHSVLVNMCEGILNELLPGIERDVLFGFEYFWRGLQGHNLPPKSLIAAGSAATAVANAEFLEWAPVCHPVVEYSKDQGFWTPRMFAATEMSKQLIPSLSIFVVHLGFDFYSAFTGKITSKRFMSKFWKGFYHWAGGLAGVAAIGAVKSFSSVRAALSPLSKLPFKLGPLIDANIPIIFGSILSSVVLSLVLPILWPWDEHDDSPTLDFQTARKYENDRRDMVYGKINAKYAKPPSFAPISPHFLHPELGRRYNALVFPERLPLPAPEVPREEEEIERDDLTKLRIELRKSRIRNAASSSQPVSATLTPLASRIHSRDASSESDSESESETSSESATDSETGSTTEGESGGDETSSASSSGEEESLEASEDEAGASSSEGDSASEAQSESEEASEVSSEGADDEEDSD